MSSRASLGTSVLRSRPSTSEGPSDPSSLSSTPGLPTATEKHHQQQQPPSLTISPATPSPNETTTASSPSTLSKEHPIQPNHNHATPNPKASPEAPSSEETEPPFSIHPPHHKTLIALAASLAALFSTLSSYIYYPALTRIAADLGVSLMLVQLTITSYLVVAGVAPAFMGDMADRGGRRPVYMLMFGLMVGANVGIAVQRRYEALLVLRMVQSAGSSGMYGAAYGVIADIATIDERGSFVGVLLLMTDFATSLGPVIGGGLTQGFGWRSIFWFLVIFTGSHFVLMLLFFPETQRKIVGNGSIKPKGFIYQTLFSLIRTKRKGKDHEAAAAREKDETEEGTPRKRRFRFPNPLACLPVLANKGSLLVIFITTINYAVKAALQTSLDAQCVELYGLNYIQAGLIYLPSGVGGGVGSYLAGKFIDWNYRRTVDRLSKELGGQYDRKSPEFPLEKTRLRGVYLLSTITVIGLIGYGLTLKFRWHIAVMLIMQLLTGTTTAALFVHCGTLLTDLNMDRSATAQAASNLVRCLSAGGAVAILQPMVENVGPAGCFAIYASIISLGIPMAWVLQRYGVSWRKGQPITS
ncbi:major facilitator superfamily domain-containing protein [Chaetomium sp. MPI-CAGE-AT-0009]|nr:major facilitator superfamily domain-containing protein [Chaetomium sp. MPI-CAGE-AT-0009]